MAILPMLPLFLSTILSFPLESGPVAQEPAPPAPVQAEAADPLAVLAHGKDGGPAATPDAPTAVAVCEFLCRSVVEAPDEVEVDVSDSRNGFRLDVQVGPGDMGRVIGKRGRVANAIRTVVGAAAAKDGVEVEVEFID